MIFYKNLKKKKSQTAEVCLSHFDVGLASKNGDSVAKLNHGEMAYNISFEKGFLGTGLGVRALQVPATKNNLDECHTFDMSEVGEVKDLLVDKWYNQTTQEYYYQVFIVDQSNKIRVLPAIDSLGGVAWVQSTRLIDSPPSYCCAYKKQDADVTIYFSSSGALCLGLGQEQLCTNVPEMKSCVVHYGNFFGITKANNNKLIYTIKTRLDTWLANEGLSVVEFLDNRGLFTKLVTFNDYVYLFRENGITKISKYSVDGEFSFTHLYYSPSKIYENSICVCGSKIFFVTRDGLYTFDGNNVSKIMDDYDVYFTNFDNLNCFATCLDGKYYLATKCDFKDGQTIGCESGTFVNNALFEIDINKKTINVLRGVDIKKLATLDTPYYSKVVCSFNTTNKNIVGEVTRDGKMFGDATQKCWTSFETDFGFYNHRKRIKEVILTSKYDCQIKVKSDEETKTFDVFGAEKVQRMQINVSGKSFCVEFLSQNQNMKIDKPKFVFDVVL